jgi:hypothetical protein
MHLPASVDRDSPLTLQTRANRASTGSEVLEDAAATVGTHPRFPLDPCVFSSRAEATEAPAGRGMLLESASPWLGGRDSNPDSLVQSQLSYH